MGKGGAYFKPRYIKVFGNSVHIDDYPTLIGASDANIQFTSWNIGDNKGEIIIGKYALITPGVRIMAAEKIEIGDGCYIGGGVTFLSGVQVNSQIVVGTKAVVSKNLIKLQVHWYTGEISHSK